MIKYAIILNPGHNRVYFDASKKLALLEFKIAMETFSEKIIEYNIEGIYGIDYLTFTSEDELNSEDLVLLSRLSFTYAIFLELKQGDDIYFKPIYKHSSYYFNENLSMILKYTGKTNELFTRFMLNVAIMIYKRNSSLKEDLFLLDPVCGKGTTLFEALILGVSCSGIDINEKLVNEAYSYLKKYLEMGKYKHETFMEKFSDPRKKIHSKRINFQIAKNKEDKKLKNILDLELIDGDSKYADSFFKKETFHLIVGDLPYGVQHGSKVGNDQGFTRNPDEFLLNSLPAWIKVLKKGGVMVLSWNTFVLKRSLMENILKENGLKLLMNDDPHAFSHRVDQAINRDMIIAVKEDTKYC